LSKPRKEIFSLDRLALCLFYKGFYLDKLLFNYELGLQTR